MKQILGVIVFCGAAIALPALAQETPFQTNTSQSAAAEEARNARGADLTSVTPAQALHNALQRCDPLPKFYKSDCIARVKGKGEQMGSVKGGGILMESVTTMPEQKLDAELNDIGPVNLPPQR